MIFKTLLIKLHNASIYSDAFAIVFERYTCMFKCKYIIIACEWMCGRCIFVLRGEYRDTTNTHCTNEFDLKHYFFEFFLKKTNFYIYFKFQL